MAITTNAILAGKVVVVAGYGYVGRAIAREARVLGARTVVTEVDPRRAIEAHMDGHRVPGSLRARLARGILRGKSAGDWPGARRFENSLL